MLREVLIDPTLLTVAIGAVLLGLTAGSLGSFAVLRRQSLLGDVMAHAALPGVVAGYLAAGGRSLPAMLAGALVTGSAAALAASWLVRARGVRPEAAMAATLGLGFAAGVVLLSRVQAAPGAGAAGLETFLFGQAAATLRTDLFWLALGGGAALAVALALLSRIELATFDPEFARASGLRVDMLDAVTTGTLAIAIVLGLQMVGVVLMASLVVAPAVAARQLTRSLPAMFAAAGAIGAGCCVAGAVLSATFPGMATGPTVVLVATTVALAALGLGPQSRRTLEA